MHYSTTLFGHNATAVVQFDGVTMTVIKVHVWRDMMYGRGGADYMARRTAVRLNREHGVYARRNVGEF